MKDFAQLIQVVFADLVIGIQAACWIAYLIVVVLGQPAIDYATGNDFLLSATPWVIIALVYSVGAALVRVYDFSAGYVGRRLDPKTVSKSEFSSGETYVVKQSEVRIWLLTRERKITDHVEYNRVLQRICNGLAANSFLALVVFLSSAGEGKTPFQLAAYSGAIEFALAGLTVLAVAAAVVMYRASIDRLDQIRKFIAPEHQKLPIIDFRNGPEK